jgi:hypothetical protein
MWNAAMIAGAAAFVGLLIFLVSSCAAPPQWPSSGGADQRGGLATGSPQSQAGVLGAPAPDRNSNNAGSGPDP